jgi:hypothetical protein
MEALQASALPLGHATLKKNRIMLIDLDYCNNFATDRSRI